ncbi:MAG: hypothetical protein ACRECH_08515 [Nitrososphaerales archaeon]
MHRRKVELEIVCDSDFLMKIVNDPLPKFDWKFLSIENEFVTLPCVLRELGGLASGTTGKASMKARNTLNVLSSSKYVKTTPEPEDHGEVDFALLQFVSRNPNERILATLDGSLLAALEKRGLGYLTLSSDKPLIHEPRQQRI